MKSITLLLLSFVLFACPSLLAQNVGIGTATPDDKLDVAGNGHFTGYLKIGNPTPPQTVSPAGMQLYGMDAGSYYNGFTQGGCGVGWVGTITGSTLQDRGGLRWDNGGLARGHRYLYSPWIWVPASATQATVEIGHYCTLENLWDGVYVEYSTDGTVWTAVNPASFYLGGYNGVAVGSNATCSGAHNIMAWTGSQDNMVTAFPVAVSGTWLQIRFVAMEDNAVGTGEYYLFNFNVFSDYGGGSHGGAFANGNIYAENNIYAGSNVLLGDLAEYFSIVGHSNPGDLISMVPSNNEKYVVSTQKHDPYVIGVHSTNPTLTLNDPNSGVPVGLQGRVPVNVVGPIKKGDYLTASGVMGHAMAAQQPSFIVGRALESFDGQGKGQILCLLENGWYNPLTPNNSTTGSFTVPLGQKRIKIIDPNMQKEAKVFVSMLGNPKTWYWIADKEEGGFSIEFEKPIASPIKFDYLIEHAATVGTTPTDTEPIVVSKTQQPIKNFNAPDLAPLLDIKETFEIPINNATQPPAVPDPNKSYWWSEATGLQTSKLATTETGQLENTDK